MQDNDIMTCDFYVIILKTEAKIWEISMSKMMAKVLETQ